MGKRSMPVLSDAQHASNNGFSTARPARPRHALLCTQEKTPVTSQPPGFVAFEIHERAYGGETLTGAIGVM
jgi:hypothetical protein